MGSRKLRENVVEDYASDVSKPSNIGVPEGIRTGKDMGIGIQNYPYLPNYVHRVKEPIFRETIPTKPEDII